MRKLKFCENVIRYLLVDHTKFECSGHWGKLFTGHRSWKIFFKISNFGPKIFRWLQKVASFFKIMSPKCMIMCSSIKASHEEQFHASNWQFYPTNNKTGMNFNEKRPKTNALGHKPLNDFWVVIVGLSFGGVWEECFKRFLTKFGVSEMDIPHFMALKPNVRHVHAKQNFFRLKKCRYLFTG